VYNTQAGNLCARYREATPTRLYHLIQHFFRPATPVADIGCGSGRDVVWLNQQGFAAIGYDASPAMLAQARRAYPGIDVREAVLPHLAAIPDNVWANVVCCATLMHLPAAEMGTAVRNLERIMAPGGRIVLSYRLSQGPCEREQDGRLFTPLTVDILQTLLEQTSIRVLCAAQQDDATRPDIQWMVLVGERGFSYSTSDE
jgi:SAM-dependent methyltransferase